MDVRRSWEAFRRRWGRDRDPVITDTAQASISQHFLLSLGSTLLAIGLATTDIQRTLQGVARALGHADASIIVLPTIMFVSIGDNSERGLEAVQPDGGGVRFDRAAEVYALVLAATRGQVSAPEGLDTLAKIHTKHPRFHWSIRIVGHGIAAAGVALVMLGASVSSMLGAVVLGALVGAAKLFAKPNSFMATLLPVFMSFITAVIVFTGAEAQIFPVPLQVLIPALVTLLPGAALTTGIQELASGDIISGSSRLVWGATQLALLAFGIVAAVVVTGLSPTLAMFTTDPAFGPYEPWIGVVLMAIGFYFYYCGPPRSLYFLTITLLAAYGAQVAAAQVFPAVFSGFVGAFVLTVVAYLLQTFRSAPPAIVCFLPAFWLLVPGAAGLIDFTQKVLGLAADSVTTFTILGSIVAIALGVVTGTAVFRQVFRLAPTRWGLQFS